MSTGGCPSTVRQDSNSMGRPAQGEDHKPNHGPGSEAAPWNEFTPEDPEATISPDASAIV